MGGRSRGRGGIKSPSVSCLFPAAVHPLWGRRRQKEKGKQPFALFLPLPFTNVAQRTLYLAEEGEGRTRPRNGTQETLLLFLQGTKTAEISRRPALSPATAVVNL